jgi:hypothetical protein
MPRTSPYRLSLTDAERTELEARARRYTSPYSEVVRAKIVLYAAGTVTCPAQHTVAIRAGLRHRVARFGVLCGSCPLRAECTKSCRARVISIHPQEAALQHAKARQQDPAWQQDYRANRPVVERKISHFTPPPLGRSKSSMPRQKRILTGILTRASALSLARLATLGLHPGPGGWAIA